MEIRVGDVGRAVTELSPGGAVELDGGRYPARSDDGVIPPDTPVEVVRGEKTCYVVRRVGSGGPLPNKGEPIPPQGFESLRARTERADRAEARAARAELVRRVWRGGAVAAVCGAVAGMASAGLGLWFDLANATGRDPVAMLAGSLAAGAVAGIVLYFFTGWFAVHVIPSEDGAAFEPNPLAVFAGLVGVALGFWLNLSGGEAGAIAAWSVGLGFAFAAVACGLAWLVGLVT